MFDTKQPANVLENADVRFERSNNIKDFRKEMSFIFSSEAFAGG